MGLDLRSRWSQRRYDMSGRPTRPCHYRAIHSRPGRSRADSYGQHRSGGNLRPSSHAQLAILPDLALQQVVSASSLDSRTGQRSERSRAYFKWFAGNLLAIAL
jgi:hypothetical protein